MTVGIDPISGKSRFDFGVTELQSGFDFVTIAVGVFGLGEIFYNLEQAGSVEIVTTKVGQVFPTMADWVKSRMAILRGTLIGFFIGIIPGGGRGHFIAPVVCRGKEGLQAPGGVRTGCH